MANLQRLDNLKWLTINRRLKWWMFLKKKSNNWEWLRDPKSRSLWCSSSKNKSTWCSKSESKRCWCNSKNRSKKCLSNNSKSKRCSCNNSRTKKLWEWQDKVLVESERIVEVKSGAAVMEEIRKPITLNNTSNKRVKKWELSDHQMLALKAPLKSSQEGALQICNINSSKE